MMMMMMIMMMEHQKGDGDEGEDEHVEDEESLASLGCRVDLVASHPPRYFTLRLLLRDAPLFFGRCLSN